MNFVDQELLLRVPPKVRARAPTDFEQTRVIPVCLAISQAKLEPREIHCSIGRVKFAICSDPSKSGVGVSVEV